MEKKIILKIHPKTWVRMLEIATKEDIDSGGPYDARANAINLWVDQRDKPIDYDITINKGALKYEKSYLATLTVEPTKNDDELNLLLIVRNYDRQYNSKKLHKENKITYEELKEQCNMAEKGTPTEWQWAIAKTHELLQKVQDQQAYKTVMQCPICKRQSFVVFNELIDCICSHGIKIIQIMITKDGPNIITDQGTITPKQYTQKTLSE